MIKKVLVMILASIVVTAVGASALNGMGAESVSAAENPAAVSQPAAAVNAAEPSTVADAVGNLFSGLVGAPESAAPSAQAGQASQWHGENGAGTGEPAPQNGLSEWLTLQGVVSAYSGNRLTLLVDGGQPVSVELGSLNYINSLGIALQDGMEITVIGFWDMNGGFSLRSLTVDATGLTFEFRDDFGRPLWSGGAQAGGGGNTDPQANPNESGNQQSRGKAYGKP